MEAEKENQQDIVDVIDEERSKVKATTQITETVLNPLSPSLGPSVHLCLFLTPFQPYCKGAAADDAMPDGLGSSSLI